MLHIVKSRWRKNRWHVYEVDTGGIVWLATFRNAADARNWVYACYDDEHQ